MTAEKWGGWIATPDDTGTVAGAKQWGTWHGFDTYDPAIGGHVNTTFDLNAPGSNADGSNGEDGYVGGSGAFWPHDGVFYGTTGEGVNIGQLIYSTHDDPFDASHEQVFSEAIVELIGVNLDDVQTNATVGAPSPIPDPSGDLTPPPHGVLTGDFQFEGYGTNVLPVGTLTKYGYQIAWRPKVHIVGAARPQGEFDDIWAQTIAGLTLDVLEMGDTETATLLASSGNPTPAPAIAVTTSWLNGLAPAYSLPVTDLPGACPAFAPTLTGGEEVRLETAGGGFVDPPAINVLADPGTLPSTLGLAFASSLTLAATWTPTLVGSSGTIWGYADFDADLTGLATWQFPRVRFLYRVPGSPPLRQFPRDDAAGGAPRQGKTSTSTQATSRQGWTATYR